MDHPLSDLIEAKIAAAEAEGAFEDLPGAGKPLSACDDPENAVLNRLIKQNGAEPAFVSLHRELSKLRAELRECSDRSRRQTLLQEMSMMETRIALSPKDFGRG